MKIVIIVPAYNEASTIGVVVQNLKSLRYEIIVVNDGSSDETERIAESAGAQVINHVINRGLGAALGTGLAYGRHVGADCLVTFDGDGQNDIADVGRLVSPIIADEADVVIGSRLLERRSGMPWHRIVANHIANVVTFLIFGVSSSDTQSGLRAFGARAIRTMSIQSSRYEVSSEIIKEIGRLNLRFLEIPITPRYSVYSLGKGQNMMEGIRTVARLLLQRFK